MTWQVFATRDATAAALAEGLGEGRVAHRCQVVAVDDLAAAAADALDRGFRRIAIEGADPEVASAVDEIRSRRAGRQTDLAVITTGKPSELLRTFAADQTLQGSIERLIRHTPYLIDAGLVEGSFGSMVFVSSVAAGVLVGGPRWFPWWPLPILPARAFPVETGGVVTEAVASGVLVLNGQFWGDRVVAPRSTTVDGVFDIQLFNGGRIALSRLRRPMRTGMHVRSHHVRRRSLSEATIEAPPSWSVAVDGIRLGRGAFSVTCLPGSVRLAI
jgi:diacylglycerol kinase family enzyme